MSLMYLVKGWDARIVSRCSSIGPRLGNLHYQLLTGVCKIITVDEGHEYNATFI